MKSKKELYILLLSFIMPIAFGTLFFYLNPGYFTKNTVNYGTLIQPVIITDKADINLPDDKKINGIWSLAYNDLSCNQSCEEHLNLLLTTRLLINDDMRRVQIISFAKSSNPKIINAQISEKLKTRLNKFPNKIFLIDPIGNVMMFYDENNFEVKKVLKDFKRLLKYSRIG